MPRLCCSRCAIASGCPRHLMWRRGWRPAGACRILLGNGAAKGGGTGRRRYDQEDFGMPLPPQFPAAEVPVEVRAAVPTFLVADAARTAAWYVEQLGFTIAGQVPTQAPYVYVSLQRGGAELMLLNLPGYQKPDLRRLRPAGLWDAYVRTDGVRAMYSAIRDQSIIASPLGSARTAIGNSRCATRTDTCWYSVGRQMSRTGVPSDARLLHTDRGPGEAGAGCSIIGAGCAEIRERRREVRVRARSVAGRSANVRVRARPEPA